MLLKLNLCWQYRDLCLKWYSMESLAQILAAHEGWVMRWYERGVHNMLHIYPMRGIFYLPNIDTGTRGRQFNISSEWHPGRILLMKVHQNFGFSTWRSNPGPPAEQASILTTRPPSCQKCVCMVYYMRNAFWTLKPYSESIILHVLNCTSSRETMRIKCISKKKWNDGIQSV